MASEHWRLVQVAWAVGWLSLACGGATRQGGEQEAAGAPAAGASGGGGLGGTAASAGTATAGAPPVEERIMCFEHEELPWEWDVDNVAGASSSECPVATDLSFSRSICYFILSDPAPRPPPPGEEQPCCYSLSVAHCR